MRNYSLQYLLENTEVRLLHRECNDQYDKFSTEIEIDLEKLGVYAKRYENTQFDVEIVHNKEKQATYFIHVTPTGTEDYDIFLWFNAIMGARLMDMFFRTIYEYVKDKRSIAELFSDDSYDNL